LNRVSTHISFFRSDGLRSADVLLLARQVVPFVEPPVRSATKVPKEIDEKHELSRRCRDSDARMRAARAPESMIMINYIDTHI
jgi:hypothetical protein